MEPRPAKEAGLREGPHPATVAQPRPAWGAVVQRSPHPATIAQPKVPFGGVPERPPHPATVAQARTAPPGPVARPPHPATSERVQAPRSHPAIPAAEARPREAGAAQRAARRTVLVVVQDSFDGSPVSGVLLKLSSKNTNKGVSDGKTDGQGMAELAARDEANYRVEATFKGGAAPEGFKGFTTKAQSGDVSRTRLKVVQNVKVSKDGQGLVTLFVDASGPPHVVVVGGGAAGLAAADALCEGGYRVTLLEARRRLGGRAFTDTSLGVPFDQGCHWMHTGPDKVHPWIAAHQKIHASYELSEDADREYALYVGSTSCPEAAKMLAQVHDEIEEKVTEDPKPEPASRALAECDDVEEDEDFGKEREATGGVLTQQGIKNMAAAMVGSLDEATEMKNFSRLDKSRVEADYGAGSGAGNNRIPEPGYGRLVADFGEWLEGEHEALLTVRTGTVVQRIRYAAAGRVLVDTDAGTVVARAVIVSVPTSIVARGRISFEPPLPDKIKKAFADLPLGNLKKVLLQFQEEIFGNDGSLNAYPYNQDGNALWRFVTREPGEKYITAFAGGGFASFLDGRQDAEVIGFALDTLSRMLGRDVRAKFIKGRVTKWGTDPYSLGAYSYGVPGHEDARATLAGAVLGDNQVFFAGEALDEKAYGTAHGAYRSGIAAVEKLKERIDV